VPYQGRTLHVRDTSGVPLEFCATMDTLPRMHTKIHTHRGAAARRMDHYQVLVPDLMKGSKFYTDIGFRISDYIAVENTDIVIGVFHYRKNNPWDMVLIERWGPRMHHFGYVVEAMHDVLRACDCAGNLGFCDNIESGPGRHGHAHSYYTYLRDPDGHRCELLLPGIQLVDIDEAPQRCDIAPGANSNLWGIPHPNSWMEEASLFADTKVVRPPEAGEPFTAERFFATRPIPANAAEEEKQPARVA
jgi:catechol 2,3-dioxygenase